MDYILSGDQREIEKILKENRIRVQRGWITFTPCNRVETDGKYVVTESDSKDLPGGDDEKKPKGKGKKTE